MINNVGGRYLCYLLLIAGVEELLTTNTYIDTDNQIMFQRLLRIYLSDQEENAWAIEGAYVSARTAGSRYGVPRDAHTTRYRIEHPDQGWALSARAVWRSGDLMQPVAVHSVIQEYHADDDDLEAARLKSNQWLRSLVL
jgi:hypothetical protein